MAIEKVEVEKIEEFIKTLNKNELKYLNRLVVERINLLVQIETSENMKRFNINDEVEFETEDGVVVKGRVIKLNKKTISLLSADGSKWKVSPQFLHDTMRHV